MPSIPAARPAPIIPFARRLYGPLEAYAYTLMRIATGAIFMPHGDAIARAGPQTAGVVHFDRAHERTRQPFARGVRAEWSGHMLAGAGELGGLFLDLIGTSCGRPRHRAL